VVKNLATLGKTVLLTTHYMDEAQYLADRVAVIAEGRIVAEGEPATLAGRDTARAMIRYRLPNGAVPPGELSGGSPDADGYVQFSPDDLVAALHLLTGWAMEQQVTLDGLQIIRPSLEDIYLELTGPPAASDQDAAGPARRRGRSRR
jgi:ABC-2 type transport system ATP-binding protein